jgi:hypothetical protein
VAFVTVISSQEQTTSGLGVVLSRIFSKLQKLYLSGRNRRTVFRAVRFVSVTSSSKQTKLVVTQFYYCA